MNINLDYVYDFQKNRYDNFSKYSLKIKNNIKVTDYSNCYLLPCRKDPSRQFGIGGVVDNNFNEIKESFILHGPIDRISFGGKYDFNPKDAEHLVGEYVYLGCAFNHWGHFLVDFCTRLWFISPNICTKYVFLVGENVSFSFISQIKRFIELCGINLDNLVICNHVCKVDRLIIPHQSYQTRKFASQEYLKIFDTVRNNIKPSESCEIVSKIYFSRNKFRKAQSSEINLEMIDSLFNNNSFNVIYPETLSLDDQIFYLNNSTEIALISGTLVHNLMFLDSSLISKKKIYVINKSHLINYITFDTLELKNISPIMIDSYAAKYPVSLGHGPFMLYSSCCLRKFIKDYGLKMYDSVYDTDEYLSQTVSKYEFIYHKINFINRQINFTNSSEKKWDYFNNSNLYLWLNQLSKYELSDKHIYNYFDSYKEISDIWLKHHSISNILFRNIIDNKFCLHSVHISNFGWTNFSFNGTYSGFINTNETMEAFVIKSTTPIKYKCYYEDRGWQELRDNNQICGVCGQKKKIQGICIYSMDKKYGVKYRLYDIKNGWTNFVNSGTKLYSTEGFSALDIEYLCL